MTWPACPTDTYLVRVEWKDIARYDGWNDEVDPQTVDAETVGWLLEDNAKQVTVASSYNWTDETWADIHVVPRIPPEVNRE